MSWILKTWDKHEVSAKAAIFNEARDRVLIMVYSDGKAYGLPGGHLDNGEAPLQAMLRELDEEIGVSEGLNITPDTFFVRGVRDKIPKLILGFTGLAPDGTQFKYESTDNDEHGEWMTLEQVRNLGDNFASGYLEFVEKHWVL